MRFSRAALTDIPALGEGAQPEYWAPWTADAAGYVSGWHSVGAHFAISAFGVNAKEAAAGAALVVPHEEASLGGQEELYVVLRGRARFTCDGETLELGPGEALHAAPECEREAIALETPTVVLMVGGIPGKPYSAG